MLVVSLFCSQPEAVTTSHYGEIPRLRGCVYETNVTSLHHHTVATQGD